jgi:hypothetical protein
MKHTTAQFDFVAKPKVTAVKPKYREEVRMDGVNLMNDPRVVRGNTYAALVETKNDIQPPPRKVAKEAPRKRERVKYGLAREWISIRDLRSALRGPWMEGSISVYKPNRLSKR